MKKSVRPSDIMAMQPRAEWLHKANMPPRPTNEASYPEPRAIPHTSFLPVKGPLMLFPRPCSAERLGQFCRAVLHAPHHPTQAGGELDEHSRCRTRAVLPSGAQPAPRKRQVTARLVEWTFLQSKGTPGLTET